MKKIYCISGLGADEKVFDKLKIHAKLLNIKDYDKINKIELLIELFNAFVYC